MDKTNLQKQLHELAFIRDVMGRQKEWIEQAQHELEQTDEYKKLQELLEEKKIHQAKLDEIDAFVRSEAVKEFDGDKHPLDGLEIKMVTVVTVTDEKSAKRWLADNAPSLLKIDQRGLDRTVKNLELPFVEVGEEAKAYIATDLSFYMELPFNQETDQIPMEEENV